VTPDLDELLVRVDRLIEAGGRFLGIVGAPGSGKSTLAERVVEHLGERARLLPMDGFHLANAELARRGIAHRKGAPDTFDVDGYISTLRRVRSRDTTVLAPCFHREIEEAVAGAICIEPDVDLVVTEGNYLLLQDPPWSGVRGLLDETWMIDIADDVRIARLVARHEHHGRSPDEARRWVAEVDELNTELIRSRSIAAALTVTLS
jgi:pantothenate kinase